MSDIFISYASIDRTHIQPLVSVLESFGWSVWWDHRTLLPGEQWEKKIEAALEKAHCVIVVWSKASIDSEWVRTESNEGKRRDILVPVLIEDVVPPLAFRQMHAANLYGWSGEKNHGGFETVIERVTTLVAKKPKIPPKPVSTIIRTRTALACALVVVFATVWYLQRLNTVSHPPINQVSSSVFVTNPLEGVPKKTATTISVPLPMGEPRLLMMNSGLNNFKIPRTSGHILFKIKGILNDNDDSGQMIAWYGGLQEKNGGALFLLGHKLAVIFDLKNGGGDLRNGGMAYTDVHNVVSGEWLQVDLSVTPSKVTSRIKPLSGGWQEIGASYSQGLDLTKGNAGVLMIGALSTEVWIKDVNFTKQK